MEISSLSTKPKVITVRKANYFVLLFPISVLILTIGIMVSAVFSTPLYTDQIQETKTDFENSSLPKVVFYWLCEVGILGVTIQKVYRHKKLLPEDISAIAFITSYFTHEFGNFFQIPFLAPFPLLLFDLIAVLMIITLVQDKPFAGMSLYQNKRIIVRE